MNNTTNLPAASAGEPKDDPRKTMEVLPPWLQPILTEITGKALPDEKPLFRWTTIGRTSATVATFAAGIGGATAAALHGGAWLLTLPAAWLLTVSAGRVMQTGLIHHASHGRLVSKRGDSGGLQEDKATNDLLGEALSLLAWLQPLELYRKDHLPGHHGRLGLHDDPDLRFLVTVGGLRPGLPVKEYWRRFWRTLFSPKFHKKFLVARLRANFVEASASRRLASFLWAALLIVAAVSSGLAWPMLVAYVIPITVLLQISAWAGLLGLHHWVREGEERNEREVRAGLTSGRFLGEAVPRPELKGCAWALAWAKWWVRLLTVHLLARIAVVPGDLPSHDWHHFMSGSWNWPNAPYARRDDLASGSRNAELYTEVWGVRAAIHETFKRLASLPPDAQHWQPLTSKEEDKVYLGM